MSKGMCIGILIIALFSVTTPAVSAPLTVHYGNVTLVEHNQMISFADIWDLTKCDLKLSYTIDMNTLSQSDPSHSPWIWVGLLDDTAPVGWMNSELGDITPSPTTQTWHDAHRLGSVGKYGPLTYDATDPNSVVTPFGTHIAYAQNFDRDGVEPWVTSEWGEVDGITFNTSGVYQIEITFHAITNTLGTMFAKVNGLDQGFWTSWSTRPTSPPDFYPAGKSFTGDLTQLRVFAFFDECELDYGYVEISDLEIKSECEDECKIEIDIKPGSYPSSVNPSREGPFPVAVFSSACFDARTLILSTIRCAGAGVAVKPNGKYMASFQDVNGDGLRDLVVHIKSQDIDLSTVHDGFTELTGTTTDGQNIVATGDINLVMNQSPGPKKNLVKLK